VVFIVIAVGAGRGLMIPASIGAIAAYSSSPSGWGQTRLGYAPAGRDMPVRARCAVWLGERQRPRPDAEIGGAAGSWRLAPRQAYGEHRTFA
jgi:hypothetical protein